MTAETIERVAKAIYFADYPCREPYMERTWARLREETVMTQDDETGASGIAEGKDRYRERARAAIEAMRSDEGFERAEYERLKLKYGNSQ